MPRIPDEVSRVARSMVADFDELLGSITDRVWRLVPSYPQVLVDQTDLREQVRDSTLNVLLCLMEDRPPTPAELQIAARNGERRALQGVAHVAVVQSYRNGERSLIDAFGERAARMQVPLAAVRLGQQQIVSILDQLEGAMLETYRAMQQRIATRTVLTEPDLMNRLVTAEPIDQADLARLVRTLGLSVDAATRVVGLAVGAARPGVGAEGPGGTDEVDPAEADPGRIAAVRHHVVTHLQAVTGHPPLSGVVREDDGAPVVVVAVPWQGSVGELAAALEPALARRRLSEDVVAAVGEPRLGLADVGGSCRQAIEALRVGWRRGTSRQVLAFRDELIEALVLRDPRMVVNLQDRYLRPLADHEHLVDTLRCHLATDLSVPETARRLVVHPNTVAYRLRRIQELTGLDLHRVRDVARAVIAVTGLDLGVEPHAGDAHGSRPAS